MPLLYFILRNRVTLTFLSLAAISLFLVVQGHYFHRSKLINASQSIIGSTHRLAFNAQNYFKLSEYNDLLIKENAKLKSQLRESFLIYSKSTDQNTIVKSHYKYFPAKIVYNTFRKANNYLILNKGKIHGIEPDMGVVTEKGVVGIVETTSKNYSTVISMLHRDFLLNVRFKKNSFFGSLAWENNTYGYVTLKDIPKQAPVQIGDTIVTDGKSFVFPEGIPIGTVSSFKTLAQQPDYYEITVQLFLNFSNVTYTYVVKNFTKTELDSLINSTHEE